MPVEEFPPNSNRLFINRGLIWLITKKVQLTNHPSTDPVQKNLMLWRKKHRWSTLEHTISPNSHPNIFQPCNIWNEHMNCRVFFHDIIPVSNQQFSDFRSPKFWVAVTIPQIVKLSSYCLPCIPYIPTVDGLEIRRENHLGCIYKTL